MSESVIDLINFALNKVIDPELHKPLPELGMVKSVAFKDGIAQIEIYLTISGCPMKDRIFTEIQKALADVPGVLEVGVKYDVMNEAQRENVKKIIRGGAPERVITFAQPSSLTRVFGIASGKGGVGKSSLTANLAVALAQRGQTVGILDADVYGHSIPRLLGLLGARPTAIDSTTFIPPENYGIRVASMEMFKPERDDAVAYRGPMLHKVLEQLLADAYWGDLDFLLLDLPPGTGDVAISLGQLIPSSEIIVITTPQVAAAEVAERAGRIAHQLKQHIAGVVENMSPAPLIPGGPVVELFGSGGGTESARRLSLLTGFDVPLLAQIPFDSRLGAGGDNGKPIALGEPETPAAHAIYQLADALMKRNKSLAGKPLPLFTK
jgi:ATP-binding protein involved in chromosome partitioning